MLNLLEAEISGDLEGIGRWHFWHADGVTTVRYEWHVRTTKRWMNWVAPLLRRWFIRNHHALMRAGAKGLERKLGTSMIDTEYGELSEAEHSSRSSNTWVRAWQDVILAGVAAGIGATIVQMALWQLASYSVVDMLLRDSRLAAAIVMGRKVLPPPASFDLIVMVVASVVHFALSIAYSLVIAQWLPRLRPLPCAITGGVFGLLLYGVNMYGFTAIFPWFEINRDWITAMAHVTFGATVALVYQWRTGNTANIALV